MWNIYYNNTQNFSPHPIIEDFIKLNTLSSSAIDLGCGAGRDTIYLIKKRMECFRY